VLKLPHSDAGSVTIAAQANTFEIDIPKHCPGSKRRHAPMQTVETERAIQEVEWAFTRAANPAELDYIFRDDIQLVTGSDDLTGDGIMPAALAKSGGIAAIIILGQPDQVNLRA
jgi:hypothetical protein